MTGNNKWHARLVALHRDRTYLDPLLLIFHPDVNFTPGNLRLGVMGYLLLTEQVVEKIGTEKPQEEFYDASFTVGGSFGLRVSKRDRKTFFVIYSLHGRKKFVSKPLSALLANRE